MNPYAIHRRIIRYHRRQRLAQAIQETRSQLKENLINWCCRCGWHFDLELTETGYQCRCGEGKS